MWLSYATIQISRSPFNVSSNHDISSSPPPPFSLSLSLCKYTVVYISNIYYHTELEDSTPNATIAFPAIHVCTDTKVVFWLQGLKKCHDTVASNDMLLIRNFMIIWRSKKPTVYTQVEPKEEIQISLLLYVGPYTDFNIFPSC
jgi:hypothetical protein